MYYKTLHLTDIFFLYLILYKLKIEYKYIKSQLKIYVLSSYTFLAYHNYLDIDLRYYCK